MKVILFHSYKGGSGKTLFSCNVAEILASNNYRTLLIEADFTMPSFKNIFLDTQPDVYFNDYLVQEKKGLDNYIYPDIDSNLGIIFCSLSFSPSHPIMGSNQDWFLSKIDQIDKDLKQLNYDFVIFDLGPGFNLFLVNTLVFANNIILISRPDYNSFRGILFLLEEIYSMISFKEEVSFSLIFNQIPEYEKMDVLLDRWIQEVEIKFPFINHFIRVNFDPETNYLNAIQNVVLPVDNKVRLAINDKIITSLLKDKNANKSL